MTIELSEVHLYVIALIVMLAAFALKEAMDAYARYRYRHWAAEERKPPRKDYTVTITDSEDFPIRVFKIERGQVGRLIGPLEQDYFKGR